MLLRCNEIKSRTFPYTQEWKDEDAEQFPEANLADLYDSNTMLPVVVKAHQALDKAVDLCYRPQPFINETKRIEFLFELHDKYTSGMFGEGKKVKKEK